MRKLHLSLVILFALLCSSGLQAQFEMWGMTYGELPSRNVEELGTWGCIFKTDASGNDFNIEYLFTALERHPKGTLMKASNGKYYGMSDGGGYYDKGTIFEYDYSTESVKVLHHFDGANTGAHPKGDLMQASNSKLYGMTLDGGTANLGVVFEFDLSDNSFNKIYDGGHWPLARDFYGKLIEASNGRLYGMSYDGGGCGGNVGAIFDIDPSSPSLTVLYCFGSPASDGSHPRGSLLEASNGKLYGTTRDGGGASGGVLFEFNIADTFYTKLQDFSSTTGYRAVGTPIEALDGNLYGMYDGSNSGGIWEYDIAGDVLSKVYGFALSDGTSPAYSSLTEGYINNVYGITNRFGGNDDGAIFKYDLLTDTYSIVHPFDFNDPQNNANVYGSLIESPASRSSGKYLCMTNVDGTAGVGTIAEYDTLAATYTIKHSFDSNSLGMQAAGSLLAEPEKGIFYGLASEGGIYNRGSLFEYDPFTGAYKKLHDFDGTLTGANPYGSLIEVNGKLYGMTYAGGVDWQGTLFEFDPATAVLSKKYDFGLSGASKPGRPYGSLCLSSNGKLYGMSSYGVSANYGALFEYDISTSVFTVKFNFDHTNGRNPEGSLIETNTDTLYGMTRWGTPDDHGAIFEYIVSTNTLSLKHDFVSATDGNKPKGDLLLTPGGILYGLTSDGGASNNGTIFKYDISGGIFTKLADLQNATTGSYPYGTPILSSDGHLYGMTSGGTSDIEDGTLFRMDTSTHVVTRVVDFDTTAAYKPQYTQLIKILVGADWTGAVSTDWHDPDNWAEAAVPTAFTEVNIPDVSAGSNRYPVVSSNTRVRDLTLAPGASVDVQNGVTLKVGRD